MADLVRYKSKEELSKQRNNQRGPTDQKRFAGRVAVVLEEEDKGWYKILFLDRFQEQSVRKSEIVFLSNRSDKDE